jgi:hypothetical protein
MTSKGCGHFLSIGEPLRTCCSGASAHRDLSGKNLRALQQFSSAAC